jgi:ABC-2 type transport system permease protein
MSFQTKVLTTEARLFAREPGTLIVGMLLPAVVLLGIGVIFSPHLPDPAIGGKRFIDLLVPSMVVISLASLGISTMPARLVGYREKGVLRRMSTTPADPAMLLVAQVAINVLVAVGGLVVLMVAGNLAFQIPFPADLVGFVAAFMLGMSALFSIGLLVAAVAPSSAVATALIWPIFVAVMFLGGVYLPRWLLPDVAVRIGDFTPPGVQAMLDAWQGTSPQLLPLAIMALITVAAGATAVKLFRWE